MKNISIWESNLKTTECPKLKENLDVDVLIIGGGITGLSCGYHLKDSNLNVVIVEANRVGCGITSRTTGKLTFMQEDVYSKIKDSNGEDAAKLYYESQKEAIFLVKEIVKKNNISCDLFNSTSSVFTNEENSISSLEEEKKLLESFGEKINQDIDLLDNIQTKYVISSESNYVFHPLKYLEGLKTVLLDSDVRIYEDSRVLSVDRFENYFLCKVNGHFIKAEKVVLALHYPYFLKPLFIPFKVHLEKSYVGARKSSDNKFFNAISIDQPVKSIRYHYDGENKYQIFLDGSRNICMDTDDCKHFDKLEDNDLDFEYLWSNIDIITGDHLPYIGEIYNNLYLGTGYNTWGMTNGSLAGKVISDIILEKENKYVKLFDPLRSAKFKERIVAIGSSLKGFISGSIMLRKYLYRGVVVYEKRNGKDVAVYVDEDGGEHVVYTRCPHLKCGLILNEKELTWDCPCHGSRFDIDGKCIQGPSNYDIFYRKKE